MTNVTAVSRKKEEKPKKIGWILNHSEWAPGYNSLQEELTDKAKQESEIRWHRGDWKQKGSRRGDFRILLAYKGNIVVEARASMIDEPDQNEKAKYPKCRCVFVLTPESINPLEPPGIPWKNLPSMKDKQDGYKGCRTLDEDTFGEYETVETLRQEIVARKKLNSWSRPGQPQFRKKILENYGRKCAVTECVIEEALEAAHIHVLKGDEDGIRKDCNSRTNGILLRSDIHALLDAFLITLSEDGKQIQATPKVLADPKYKFLEAAEVFQPNQERPLAQNIEEHRKRYFAKKASDMLKG
jgi:HNH endonuclease